MSQTASAKSKSAMPDNLPTFVQYLKRKHMMKQWSSCRCSCTGHFVSATRRPG